MRSNKPKRGLLLAVLLMLAAAEIAAGTCVIFAYRAYMDQTASSKPETEYEQEQIPEEEQVPEEEPAPEEDISPEESDPAEDDSESSVDEEEKDEETDIETETDEEEKEEKPEKNYVVMIVKAPDNYAAVRAGRGTEYQEVGRITNGHRVALTDLNNGWYKIAKGKYKGYYTHQSSYVSE